MKHRIPRAYRLFITPLLCCLGLSGCSRPSAPAFELREPNLVIFTYQPEAIYEPLIKEYQERTGLSVKVLTGTYQDLRERAEAGTLAGDCDVVFGINSATLEQTPELWTPYTAPSADMIKADFTSRHGLWTGFSTQPLVIMYNTRVVTYRELPEGWHSLLEQRWQGQIAFIDPELSDLYAGALAAAMHAAPEPSDYVRSLAANLDYQTFASLSEVNLAIAEGRQFLGVVLEEDAEALRREGADIDYIYPQENTGLLVDGSALVAGCRHPQQGQDFLDFTVSKDVQYFLTATLNRRSVREDIPPPSGLTALTKLPPAAPATHQQPDQYHKALSQWRLWMSRGRHTEERR